MAGDPTPVFDPATQNGTDFTFGNLSNMIFPDGSVLGTLAMNNHTPDGPRTEALTTQNDPDATLEIQNGLQLTGPSGLTSFMRQSDSLVLDADSHLTGGSAYSVQSFEGPPTLDTTLLVNGTVTLDAIGKNTLNLQNINLIGGTIIQNGENDLTEIGKNTNDNGGAGGGADGTHIVLNSGTLAVGLGLHDTTTVGPLDPTATAASFGFLAEVDFAMRFKWPRPVSTPSTGALALLDQAGNTIGSLNFGSDASGLNLNLNSQTGLLAIHDFSAQAGNIPLMFHG